MDRKYLRMIGRMKTDEGARDWNLYILRCGDGSLYTGIAKDVERRLQRHGTGRGAAYTRSRLPLELVYSEKGMTRSEALIREAQIKRLPRKRKETLIAPRQG